MEVSASSMVVIILQYINMLCYVSEGKESICNEGDPSLIPGLGRSSGEGHGNPLQYSSLENPMDRETWWTTVHRITKSQT